MLRALGVLLVCWGADALAQGVPANATRVKGFATGALPLCVAATQDMLVFDSTTNTTKRCDGAGSYTAVASGDLSCASCVSLASEVSGTLPVANGGTGAATLAANNVLLGNGTSALQVVAPGTTGNVLTSNGTSWTSAAPAGGGTIGSPGQALRTILPLGLADTNDTLSNKVVGRYAFNKADYTVTNLTTTFVFEAVCSVSIGTATCEMTLRDLTNATTVATMTTSNTDPERQVSATLVLAAGLVVYEARFRLSAGTPVTDVASLGSAVVRVNQTF